MRERHASNECYKLTFSSTAFALLSMWVTRLCTHIVKDGTASAADDRRVNAHMLTVETIPSHCWVVWLEMRHTNKTSRLGSIALGTRRIGIPAKLWEFNTEIIVQHLRLYTCTLITFKSIRYSFQFNGTSSSTDSAKQFGWDWKLTTMTGWKLQWNVIIVTYDDRKQIRIYLARCKAITIWATCGIFSVTKLTVGCTHWHGTRCQNTRTLLLREKAMSWPREF